MSSWSTIDLWKVVSSRIARAFKISWATQAVALNLFKAFDRIWYASVLHKHKSSGILGLVFCHDFLYSSQWKVLLMGSLVKKYLVNGVVPQASVIGLTSVLLYRNDLSDNVISNIAIEILFLTQSVIRFLICGND